MTKDDSTPSALKLIISNFGKLEEAQSCVRDLLAQRLIACANLIPNVISLYHWENELTEDHECLVIMKTLNHQTPSVVDYLESHHSYDIPEIIILPVNETTDAYLSWIKKEIS